MLTRTPCRRRFRPHLELLEERLAPALTINFNPANKQLDVTSDGGDDITCAVSPDGNFLVNGVPQVPADRLLGLRIQGGPQGNRINLEGLNANNCPGLADPGRDFDPIAVRGTFVPRIKVLGGGGNDDFQGGNLAEHWDGQGGRDTGNGGDGDDVIVTDAEDFRADGGGGKNKAIDSAPVNQDAVIGIANLLANEFHRRFAGAGQQTTFIGFSEYSLDNQGREVTVNLPDGSVLVGKITAAVEDREVARGDNGLFGIGMEFEGVDGLQFALVLKMIFDDISKLNVNGGDGTQTIATEPLAAPVALNDIDNVSLGTFGTAYSQNGTLFELAGYASVDTGNATNVVQEELLDTGIIMTKSGRPVGKLVEYTVDIFNVDAGDTRLRFSDPLFGGTFQGNGTGDIKVEGVTALNGSVTVSADFVIPNNTRRTIQFFVRPTRPGTLTNDAVLERISEAQGELFFHEIARESCTLQVEVAGAGPILNDVANNGMASQTSDGSTSMGVGLAGANALFTSDYTDIFLNAPGNTQPGHLAHGDPFMVDVAPDGTTPGNGFVSSFSSDDAGRFIAFASNATNLVAGITEGNSGSDIYFRDMARGTTILVSRNRDNPNQTPNRTSQLAVVSGNGKYVYFLSQATDLVTTPLNSTQPHLYRFNTATGVTELVNLNAAETGSGNRGVGFGISTTFDGELVAFESLASDLTADANVNDPNTELDVFVRNMVTGVTDLVSHHHTNATTGNLGSNSPTISRNGAVITYVSRATDIVDIPDANNSHPFNKQDVFAYDVATKVNALVSINAAGAATGEQSSIAPKITPDARFVAFQSQARDLVTGFTGFGTQNNLIYVRDLLNDTTQLISVDPSGTTVANHDAQGPSISDDGRFVAFISRATNLTTLADANNTFDAFVRDRLTDTTTLLSVNLQGTAAGNGGSFQSLVTADGKTVYFPSESEDLVSNDGNGKGNIFSSADHLRFIYRVQADGNPADLLLVRNGGNYEVQNAATNAVLASRPAAATRQISIVGANGQDDTLRIDFSSGIFTLPQGIRFAGGSGGNDRLVTVGDFATVSYVARNATDGVVEYDGLAVGYTGLEGFVDATAKQDVAFLALGGDNAIRLSDDGTANNGMSRLDSNGTGAFLAHVFADPSAVLLVQGGEGADTMTVAGVDAAFDAALVLSGGSGDDTLDASVFGRDVILRGGSGANTLRGGGGNDTFVVTPDSLDVVGDGGGSDTLDFRNAFAAITLNLDLQNVNQVVNQFGASLRLLGDFENVVGSAYSDTLFLAPAAFARQVQGHSQVIGVPGGDVLHFAAAATDDGATISTAGFADVTYAGIEAVNLGSAPRDGGDVQVVLVNGKLTLTGDVKDNFVRLELGVTGAKTVRVTGLEGTRLNGQGGPLEFANVRKGVTAGLGDGNDRFELTGSQVAGAMKLDGGNGDDVYRLATTKTIVKVVDTVGSDRLDFSGAAAGVKVNLASTLSQAVGSGNTLTLKGTVEQLVGSAFNDVLKGNTAANILLGLAGDDRLTDKKGQNLLVGGMGRDTLTGGALEDILIGGRTVYDDDPHTLTDLMAEFLANGRANLEAGDDPRLVQGDTVLDDAVLDTLFADAADWTFS